MNKPEILAPAGGVSSFLAALAAGADAIYLGLKHFSARMQAENFSLTELSQLVQLAHSRKCKVYVAMNIMLKPDELDSTGRLITRLARDVNPDALIIQDLGMVKVARMAGFKGEIHLSTLANITHASALKSAQDYGADRVVLPRELTIDEVRTLGENCPEGLQLEMFVHGALCYCVSGRCWWSSYMGGKSGLRGRCVQPCRRVYKQRGNETRFFSCQDLSLDVLVKALSSVPEVNSWKIEGRKKGPHYVFYVVTAYKLLRDFPDDPQKRKQALALLDFALGRPGTHANFLPQSGKDPIALGEQTSSGLLAGKIVFENKKPVFKPRFDLLSKDFLRVGVEDEPWHATLSVGRGIPKGGTYALSAPAHKMPKAGTPVYLIDRREPGLTQAIADLKKELAKFKAVEGKAAEFDYARKVQELPRVIVEQVEPVIEDTKGKRGGVNKLGKMGKKSLEIVLVSALPQGKDASKYIKPGVVQGLWLTQKTSKDVSRTLFNRISWWLPPVIWPEAEKTWQRLVHCMVRDGARHFVLGAPWQMGLFTKREGLVLTAGPFCNIANAAAIQGLQDMGFAAAFVSPELTSEDFLALPGQSVLPLGVVIDGYWPCGISRYGTSKGARTDNSLVSPRGEQFWTRRYGGNTWIYPAWPLDITAKRTALENAGYSIFAHCQEAPPQLGKLTRQLSEFNWDGQLL